VKRCQKCFSENDSLMSFCWECGAPLPELFETNAKTQEMPAQLFPTKEAIATGESPAMKTIEANTLSFITTPQSTTQPPKNKMFLVVGGIGALLALGVLTAVGIAAYNLIPSKKTVVTVKTTPTPTTTSPEKVGSPTPKTSPNTTFTPPVEPTKEGSFTVYANKGWQLSDISTVANEEFTTTVKGKIDIALIKNDVSPSGVNDNKTKSRRIHPEFPTGALLMRTRYADGKYSNVVSMTTNGANGTWLNYPDERGKIEFCINDNAPEDNDGQFVVTAKFSKIVDSKKK
jgi:hypothetical protein